MKFETLQKDYRKYWIIGCIVVIVFGSVMFFVGSRANYKVTQKVNIANGIINWSPSDLDIIAIKISSDGSNYSNTDIVPTSGYALNTEKSACKLNGAKLNDVAIEYTNGKIKLDNLTKKGTKCEFYFDELCGVTCRTILANKTIEERTDFSRQLTENTTGKIYQAQDNDGMSYYFAGAVDNNWVKFGGFYWRIIRINGDGTFRLIYNGTSAVQTGITTQIGTSAFNSSKDDNTYVGYMYGAKGAGTYNATHANTNSSNIKDTVDNWYNTNLNKDGIKEHIDPNAGFCGDRSIDTVSGYGNGLGYSKNLTGYNGRYRLDTNKTPSLKCTNVNDLYTVSSSNKGNKGLTYPVGLISADEVAYAGGVFRANDGTSANSSYYLYTNQTYWTMSPYSFDGGGAYVFVVYFNGHLDGYGVYAASGARPVINLKADTKFSKGNGTNTSPFEI